MILLEIERRIVNGLDVRRGNDVLRQALNWAMFRVWEKGRYTDLWLRYFSVSPF